MCPCLFSSGSVGEWRLSATTHRPAAALGRPGWVRAVQYRPCLTSPVSSVLCPVVAPLFSLLSLNMSIFFLPGPFVQASTQQAAAPPEWGSQQLC